MFQNRYTLKRENGQMIASINQTELFRVSAGVRVETDLEGNIQKVIGIETTPVAVTLTASNLCTQGTLSPNGQYILSGKTLRSKPKSRFTIPKPNLLYQNSGNEGGKYRGFA